MEVVEIQPWLFQIEPLQGESLSHFLGRFRQANDLTPTGLGKATKLGGAIARWEKFRFNPLPSRQQLKALAKVVGVDVDRLVEMLPPVGAGMKIEPIRLCAACYTESYHFTKKMIKIVKEEIWADVHGWSHQSKNRRVSRGIT